MKGMKNAIALYLDPVYRAHGTGHHFTRKDADTNPPRQETLLQVLLDGPSRRQGPRRGSITVETGEHGIADHFVHVPLFSFHRRHLHSHQVVEEADNSFWRISL